MIAYPMSKVLQGVTVALERAGLSSAHAEVVAGAMVDAEARGHHSHGLQLLPVYLQRIRDGGINAHGVPAWVREDAALAILDGRGAAGQVAAMMAAERCATLASAIGVAVVAVRHTNHVGMLAAYRGPFQRAGVAGLVLNLAGTSVAPPGGCRATMGNNALCLIVPRRDAEPFSIDFATGAVACGKIRQAASQGRSVPTGWLLDRHGFLTTDPTQLDEGGAVPVFGGHKGLALSLIIEILGGALAGGITSRSVSRQRLNPGKVMNCAQLFVGLQPAAFGVADLEPFVNDLREAVRDAYTEPPREPWFPDQAEACALRAAVSCGLALEPETARLLDLR
jgi:LDH2 family malate/lactate/ureidoglycolate dehydrogenase